MTVSNVIGNLFGGVMTDVLGIVFSPLMSIRITLIIGSLIFLIGLFRLKIKEKQKLEIF